MCTDVRGQVRERNEDNNCKLAGTVTLPDAPTAGAGDPPVVSPPVTDPPFIADPPVADPPVVVPPAPLPEIDRTPPETTLTDKPAALVNARSALVSFSSTEASSTFECRLDGGAWAACLSPTAYSSLADGQHAIEVRATDVAGNTDPTPAAVTWTVDTAPPDTTLTTMPSALVSTRSAAVAFTSSEVESTFECRLDGGAWATCATPSSYAGLADGQHIIDVRATDLAGNTDPSPASVTWTVDATPPDTTLTTTPAALSNVKSAQVAFASSEAGGTFECRIDTGAWAQCNSPKTYTNLSDGEHTIDVRATDLAGTADPSPASVTWKVDTIAPITTITSGLTGDVPAGPISYAFASNEPGSTFQCRFDAGAYTTCTSPFTIDGPSTGAHTFTVRATDEAGNTETAGPSRSWTTIPPGADAPDTSITTQVPERTLAGQLQIAFAASKPGSSFQCSLDDAAFTPCTSPYTYANAEIGEHTLKVRGIGAFGSPDPTPAQVTWHTVHAQVDLCGDIITDRTLSPDEALVYVVTCTMTVKPGANVTIEPGAIIKAANASINVEGALTAQGTAANPVIFTSANDDSVGGDTNGNGTDTAPEPGDWSGLHGPSSGTGSVTLQHTTVRYADQALTGALHALSIQNSKMEDANAGSAVTVGTAPRVQNTALTRTRNPSYSAAGSIGALSLYSDHIDPDYFNGNTHNGVVGGITLAGKIDSDGSLDSTTTPLGIGGAYGTGLDITNDANVTITAGTIIKANTNGGRLQITSGALTAQGTAANPVIFTSANDDSVGGDTNGNGTDTAPEPGDWSGLQISNGDVAFEHASIRYASTAIAQSGGLFSGESTTLGTAAARVGTALTQSGGDAALRGTIAVTDFGISSCAWGSTNCGVDASRVDWTSEDGPADKVCGQVFTSPYLHNGAEQPSLWTTPCGTGGGGGTATDTPPSRLNESRDAFYEGLAALQELCADAEDQSACEAADTAIRCLSGAASAAGADSPFPYPSPEGLPDPGSTFADKVVGAAETFLSKSKSAAARAAGRLLSVVGLTDTVITLGKLAIAYDNCAP